MLWGLHKMASIRVSSAPIVGTKQMIITPNPHRGPRRWVSLISLAASKCWNWNLESICGTIKSRLLFVSHIFPSSKFLKYWPVANSALLFLYMPYILNCINIDVTDRHNFVVYTCKRVSKKWINWFFSHQDHQMYSWVCVLFSLFFVLVCVVGWYVEISMPVYVWRKCSTNLAHLPPRKRKTASLVILSLLSILKFVNQCLLRKIPLTSDDTGHRHLLFYDNTQ